MPESKKIFLVLFFAFFVYEGCGDKKQETALNKNPSDITVLQLREQMKNDSTLAIIDVRTEEELTGELPKIERALHVPLKVIETRIDELYQLKKYKIAVICRTGRRSSIAASILRKHGFNVENVLGGMEAYLKK
jgi:rhodanese-related sulfurtransferase